MSEEARGTHAANNPVEHAATPRHGGVGRFFAGLGVLAVGLVIGAVAISLNLFNLGGLLSPGQRTVEVTVENLEEIVSKASDLVTTEYFYTDAQTRTSSKELFGHEVPFTTSTVVFTYSGTIKLGVDLSQVRYAIDNAAKTIEVALPAIGIVSNEIDERSFTFPLESSSVFNPTTISVTTDLLAQLKEAKAAEVLGNERIMESARANTALVLRDFLTANDLTRDYTVTFA